MCMSTTGFGPGAVQTTQHRPTTAGSSTTNTNRTQSLQRMASTAAGSRPAFNSASFTVLQQGNAPRFDMNLSDLFSEAETKIQAINRPSYGLEFPGSQQQYQQQQHIQRPTRQAATYQPPHLAPTLSTNASSLHEDLSAVPTFGSQTQTQAHQQQSFRPPVSTTSTAGFDTVPETNGHDFNDLQGVADNDLLANMAFFNDPAVNAMYGGVGGGGASLFDGSRISDWNMAGQDWGNLIGNPDEQGATEQTGHGSGSGIDMFGGLFFG